jgi:sterol desaturase/sphingolipid hydroxylase (fatty acid hydroxylase superfamily)
MQKRLSLTSSPRRPNWNWSIVLGLALGSFSLAVCSQAPAGTEDAHARGEAIPMAASPEQSSDGALGSAPRASHVANPAATAQADARFRPITLGIISVQLATTMLLVVARLISNHSARLHRLAEAVLEAGKYILFPIYYLGFIFAQGLYPSLLVTLLALGMMLVMEYVIPFRPEWNKLGRQELNDVLHFLFSSLPGDTLARIMAFSLVPPIVARLPYVNAGLWPHQLSFPFQVVLVVVLFEASVYTTHYLSHHLNPLWNFHRLHHTSGRITLSKGFRRNIQEAILESSVSLAVAIVFGVPQDALAWLVAFQLSGTIFAHANVQMYVPALLERIFITPAAHRIHHSVDLRYGNTNFGNTLMIFDVLFGTYTDHRTHQLGEMGVANNSVPTSFLKQWFLPFYWDRLDQAPTKQDGWK